MKTVLEKGFIWTLLAPVFLALVYINGLLYPYVTLKTLLMRGLGIIALALFIYLSGRGRIWQWYRLREWTAWIPGALLVVAYITSLAGIDFYHSLWSIFDRGDGLLTLTALVVFFYCILLSAHKAFIDRLFSLVAWVGSFVAIYSLLQWIEQTTGMNLPIIQESRGRLGGTLGNAAFLAGYLGITFFVTLAYVRDQMTLRAFTPWIRKALIVGAIIQLLVILLTATRGTILALLMVGIGAVLYRALKGDISDERAKKYRQYARIGFIGLILCGALFFGLRGTLKESSFEPIRRMASISVNDTTVSSRLFVWKNVLKEALQHPLKGVGAEHIDVLFNNVYDPSAIAEEWFDRSHNAYLDYFAQYGIAGVGLYIALIIWFALYAFRLWRKKNRFGPFLLLGIGVYAIQSFFVFDTAVTLWLIFTLYAIVLIERKGDIQIDATVYSQRATKKYIHSVSGVIGMVILFTLYPVLIRPLHANMLLARGYVNHIIDVHYAISVMEKGLSLETYADLEYGYQAYVMYTERQQNLLEGEERIAAYEYARDILAKNFEKYPYDARTAIYFAHVLDSAPPEIEVDDDVLRIPLARAMKLSPKRTQAYYISANIFLKKGDKAISLPEKITWYKKGIEVLKEYVMIAPNLAEPRFIIASLYQVIGDDQEAEKWASEGLERYKGLISVARRAVGYYVNAEKWTEAKILMEDIVKSDPADMDTLYDLAKVYFLTGEKEKALLIVDELRKTMPGFVESDQVFLQALEG